MIKSYFVTAFRHLSRHKFFSFINIIGLSAGITCCILISTYVLHELNYDKQHTNGNRIVRAIMEYSMGGNSNKGNYTSAYLGPNFKKNFPEIEEFVRMTVSKKVVRLQEKLFLEERFAYADSTFFKLFSFPLISGHKASALAGPNKIILTRSMVKKYFGEEDPIGKTIKISTAGVDYMVTGVMEDCPENSHLKFDFLASFSSLELGTQQTYWNANYTTYFLLKNEHSLNTLQNKIPLFMKQEMKSILTGEDFVTYELEPFFKIHLHSPYSAFENNGSITYVKLLFVISLLILVIASFTFVNLSTARASERAKEIGIRKVAGAHKFQVFWQFIGESFIAISIALVTSFLLSSSLLTYFNGLMAREISLREVFSAPIIAYSLVLLLLVSFFAGSYPALLLSSFQPVKVLKGTFKNTTSGQLLRKSLFVLQFVVTVFLIICASTIQKQLHFIQTKNLGFDRDHVLIMPYDPKIHAKFDAFKNSVQQCSGVVSVAKGDFEPSNIVGGYSMQRPDMLPDKSYAVHAGTIDQNYLSTCGISLLTGSNLSEKDVESASNDDYTKNYFHFVLNESAARQMGWTPEEAVGKKMYLDETRPGEVKAVVKDFHFASLHQPIKPLVLFPGNYCTKILVKLNGRNLEQNLVALEKIWKTQFQHRPFEYSFLDESYKKMYFSEIKLGESITVFTGIAILLACLGLFGLSSYSIQQRTKEIGILKVLGAPIWRIMTRLSGNFLMLVTVAIFISIPLAWLVMREWLQDYAYRISLNFSLFALAALASLLLAFITISFKTLSAAKANPVKNLRTE